VLDSSIDTNDGSALFARLSQREEQVLDGIALGLTNNEVALRLHVTVHAVKFHLVSIYRKLGVANRTEAAVLYLRAQNEPSNPPELDLAH
jgi:DNA-binding NarL/FixJ family response regulator